MATAIGPWTIEAPLSEGGQAHTFVVRRTASVDDSTYVLKRFKNRSRLARSEAEISALASVSSPHVVKIVAHDLGSATPHLVMEHCAGGTLERLRSSGVMAPNRVLSVFAQVVEGVAAVHDAGFVHRDIKPANILLRSVAPDVAVLGDFGLVFIPESERATELTEAVGPRNFIAPELEDGRLESVTQSADVYSLGKLLYWLFAGRIFSREKHRAPEWNLALNDQRNHFWHHLNELLDRCVVHDVERRLANAQELRQEVLALSEVLGDGRRFLDDGVLQPCMFCRTGNYRLVARSEHGKLPEKGHNEMHNFGHGAGSSPRMLWHCSLCGHVAEFTLLAGCGSNWRLH